MNPSPYPTYWRTPTSSLTPRTTRIAHPPRPWAWPSHAEVVTVGPVLGHLAVLDAEPVALGDREPAVSWWEGRLHRAVGQVADEGPGLATAHGCVDGDEFAVVGDVVDLPGQVRERLLQPPRGGEERGRPGPPRVGRLLVRLAVERVRGEDRVEFLSAAVRHHVHGGHGHRRDRVRSLGCVGVGSHDRVLSCPPRGTAAGSGGSGIGRSAWPGRGIAGAAASEASRGFSMRRTPSAGGSRWVVVV